MFLDHCAEDPKDALRMINRILKAENTPRPFAYDEKYSVHLQLIKQTKRNNCGPASAYMAISGWNGTSAIAGNSISSKLDTLERQMEMGESAIVHKMASALNKYVSSYQYSYYEGKLMDKDTFCNYLVRSLGYKRAPILHARTEYLRYYKNHSTGYDITVSAFDGNTLKITLYDPYPNNAYYGVLTVFVDEAFACIYNSPNRFMIAY